jgi:hypothetical protein
MHLLTRHHDTCVFSLLLEDAAMADSQGPMVHANEHEHELNSLHDPTSVRIAEQPNEKNGNLQVEYGTTRLSM